MRNHFFTPAGLLLVITIIFCQTGLSQETEYELIQVRPTEISDVLNQKETTMVRLLVLYGNPEDPAAFDSYYSEIHIPLAKRMKGLKKWTIGKVQGTPDGEPSDYYYIADLYADSRAELEAIFESPEGRAAVDDVPKFASGGVTFLYTEVEEVLG